MPPLSPFAIKSREGQTSVGFAPELRSTNTARLARDANLESMQVGDTKGLEEPAWYLDPVDTLANMAAPEKGLMIGMTGGQFIKKATKLGYSLADIKEFLIRTPKGALKRLSNIYGKEEAERRVPRWATRLRAIGKENSADIIEENAAYLINAGRASMNNVNVGKSLGVKKVGEHVAIPTPQGTQASQLYLGNQPRDLEHEGLHNTLDFFLEMDTNKVRDVEDALKAAAPRVEGTYGYQNAMLKYINKPNEAIPTIVGQALNNKHLAEVTYGKDTVAQALSFWDNLKQVKIDETTKDNIYKKVQKEYFKKRNTPGYLK